jgi:hypothetical protein
MTYEPTKEEKKILVKIEQTYYMQPVLRKIGEKIAQSIDKKVAWQELFNDIHSLLLKMR